MLGLNHQVHVLGNPFTLGAAFLLNLLLHVGGQTPTLPEDDGREQERGDEQTGERQ